MREVLSHPYIKLYTASTASFCRTVTKEPSIARALDVLDTSENAYFEGSLVASIS